MTICLMFIRLVFDFRVSCDFTSAVLLPNSMGISLGEGEGSWLSPIAARTLSLPNEALLLLKSGEAKMDGGDTNGIRGFGA